MHDNVVFNNKVLPYFLLAPQLVITLVFFIWPAGQALYQSFLIEDAFGFSREFVWLDNFIYLFSDDEYWNSIRVTFVFSGLVAFSGMAVALLLAAMADRVIKGATTYKTLLIWPYAVAPVVAAVIWWLMFNPSIGILAFLSWTLGHQWNHYVNANEAMAVVVIASAWKQISYNFIFFLAGMQAIPRSLIEAAAIDGSGPFKRFWQIVFPLLSPIAFFLLVVNVVYAFFETFGVIHATTLGGPGNATRTLVYKVYEDGFVGLDMGSSAAQSVILMILVITLTIIQFKFIERKVQY
ncbi:sn-glycerol-3-phosphate ABC transporter permease UgpA [Natronospirillum operosum]|uniref:sn-glycerol-3-phosphate transport system permease protein UgpA n=1 Tax=Natronospirillum operosum TaxID=2759953 RepID=A0A4Z0WAC9_9GAMM|nr:sn-glycerol-3-phosphate ABC transporter permease UgpA [Natronospirillum operosum]TGG90257.1 sn-glycerol-3-phosphate ABC transporter permease UgpA [Natronospirillum operosum]